MGSTNQVFQSNPYADFDPSQYSNPYSPYPSSALPFPSQYMGWPTDAMGNPIAKPPGMTLNSQPAAAPVAAAPAAQTPGRYVQTNPGGMLPSGENYGSSSPTYIQPQYQYMPAQQQQQAAPQAPAAPAVNNAGLTPQQYLQLKANPGPVSNPGATVPQATSTAGSPGVLQNFLANWNPAQGGPGAGFQQGFAKSLKGLGY